MDFADYSTNGPQQFRTDLSAWLDDLGAPRPEGPHDAQTLWRSCAEPWMEPDLSNVEIQASPEGDDYVLNGEGRFTGTDARPDYLWTLVITDSDVPACGAMCAFLVPAGLDGISVRTPRTLVHGHTHLVTFDQVRVPLSFLMGDSGEGWTLMRAALLAEDMSSCSPNEESLVADLLVYARETFQNGVALIDAAAIQQLLMDAYIDSHIGRLFRMRDTWMRATKQTITYQGALTALWEKRAALRLSETALYMAGPYALLEAQDPRGPLNGALELQQRTSLTRQSANGTISTLSTIVAGWLGLDQSRETAAQQPERAAS